MVRFPKQESAPVRIWNLDSEPFESRVILDGGLYGRDVDFSPDGQKVAVAQFLPRGMAALDVVDLATNSSKKLEVDSVGACRFTKSGDLITSHFNGLVRQWDKNFQVVSTRRGHSGALSLPVIHPDQGSFATCGHDRTTRIWSLKKKVADSFVLAGDGQTSDIIFSKDDQFLAKVGDRKLKVWRIDGRDFQEHVNRELTQQCHKGVFSANSELFATALQQSEAGRFQIQIWDVDNWTARDLAIYADEEILHIRFSPDGDAVIADSAKHTYRWSLDQGELQKSTSDITHQDSGRPDTPGFPKYRYIAGSLTFRAKVSPDGGLLAYGYGSEIHVFNRETNKPLKTLTAHSDFAQSIAFSENGQWLATGSQDRNVFLWETNSWEKVAAMQTHSQPAGIAVSPKGDCLAVGCGDGSVLVSDVRTGVRTLTFQPSTRSIAVLKFSHDGTILAAVAGNNITIWNSRTRPKR